MAASAAFLRAYGVAAIGLVFAGSAVSTDQAKPGPHSAIVTIENVQFNPAVLTIRVGERVTWVNKDLFPHTATADDKSFDSHGIAPSASWTFVAVKPGTYFYTCAFHPTMKGTLKVQ
jgi:plastocyanin